MGVHFPVSLLVKQDKGEILKRSLGGEEHSERQRVVPTRMLDEVEDIVHIVCIILIIGQS